MSKISKRFQKSPTDITKVDKVLTPVKILERYSPKIIEFGTVREFQEYFTDHKEEMVAMTTQKLNKTYRVYDGDKHYTITRKLGEISLKRSEKDTTENDTTTEELIERIDALDLKIDAIVKVLEAHGLLRIADAKVTQ